MVQVDLPRGHYSWSRCCLCVQREIALLRAQFAQIVQLQVASPPAATVEVSTALMMRTILAFDPRLDRFIQQGPAAAVAVQSWWRACRMLRLHHAKRRAAVKLQALARGIRLPASLVRHRTTAVTLQTLLRGGWLRRLFVRQRCAAAKAQTSWRANWGRRQYARQRRAAMSVQRQVRLALGSVHARAGLMYKRWRAAEEELSSKEKQLIKANTQLTDANEELTKTKAQLADSNQRLTDGNRRLARKDRQLSEASALLAEPASLLALIKLPAEAKREALVKAKANKHQAVAILLSAQCPPWWVLDPQALVGKNVTIKDGHCYTRPIYIYVRRYNSSTGKYKDDSNLWHDLTAVTFTVDGETFEPGTYPTL